MFLIQSEQKYESPLLFYCLASNTCAYKLTEILEKQTEFFAFLNSFFKFPTFFLKKTSLIQSIIVSAVVQAVVSTLNEPANVSF